MLFRSIEPAIHIPPDAHDITISSDGMVSAMQPGQTAATQLGQLTLARFANPPGLQAIGGNLYLETNLSVGDTNLHWLLEGRPDEAREVVDEAMRRWSRRDFQVQHWYELHSRGQIDLYQGDPRAALERIDAGWGDLRRSMQLRVQISRIKALHLRARAALATAALRPSERALIVRATHDAHALEREGGPWSRALSRSVRAGAARIQGDLEATHEHLVQAIAAYEEADMIMHAAFARRALGVLQAGDAGRSMREQADLELERMGLVEREPIGRLLIPGV